MPEKASNTAAPAAEEKERPKDAADAAVAEVAAESEPDDAVVTFEFRGETFTFKRKKLRAIQFLGSMQKDRDIEATEWLLGERQYARFLYVSADADGCTTTEDYLELMAAIGKAVGSPNS